MKTSCPNCGAEVEFRYDDSFVRICGHCRNAVVRTDRGVDSLGQVADLVPMESQVRLFAEGRYQGIGFMVVGVAQLRHAAGGMWQEWYAKLDDGRWGWLAEAQGRMYLTFEEPTAGLPAQAAFSPGVPVELPVGGQERSFTVGELGTASYVSASGELPYRLVPQGTFRFVDLADGQGGFATIDYGDEGDTPALYSGRQVTLAELGIHGGEVGPSTEKPITSTRLACPTCNAPVELRAPDASQRVVCAYCNSLISVQSGVLALLGKLPSKATSSIPLGSKGTFLDGELTLIGYVQRAALIEGTWYPFDEYLLYAPQVGFRWLVCSDGHWSYVQPIATGAVNANVRGAFYDGVRFRSFQTATLEVQAVLGEFYWQVSVGEKVESEDLIAPPAMVSVERSSSEENWSLSTYLTPGEVQHAFGDKDLPLGEPQGAAPNQPNRAGAAANVLSIGMLVLLALGIVFAALAPNKKIYNDVFTIVPASTLPLPPPADATGSGSATDTPAPNVMFSKPFELSGDRNVAIRLSSQGLQNNWAYVAADLVHMATGKVASVDANLEYYSGYEDGESWSEGSHETREVVGPMPAGAYTLRLEGQQGAATAPVDVTVEVDQGVFRGKYLAWALLVLGIPLLGFGLSSWSFERKRWDNSSQGTSGAPTTPVTILVLTIGGVFYALYWILKSAAESSSDD